MKVDENLVRAIPAPGSMHLPAHAGLGMAGTRARVGCVPQSLQEVLAALLPFPSGEHVSRSLLSDSLAHRAEGRLNEALECLKAALQSEPNRREILIDMGEVYFKMNRSEEGLECWRQVGGLSPEWGQDLGDPRQMEVAVQRWRGESLLDLDPCEAQVKIAEVLIGS
jgi:tetratricopeptide (TPR) repeat protein